MPLNLLHLMRPLTKVIPSIQQPQFRINNRRKTLNTAIVLFVYLTFCQIPLYGISKLDYVDPLRWIRGIIASSRGSLMELGLSPIITAGWAMNFLSVFNLVNLSAATTKDKQVYEVSMKVLAIIMAFGEAVATVTYGAYSHLPLFNQCLVVVQLLISTILFIYIDDILTSGYGLGSGISLFIAVNCAENLFWDLLSPVTLNTEYGMEFQGSLVNLVYMLVTSSQKTRALWICFTRENAPNIASLFGTIFIFFIVIYLQRIKAYVPLIFQKSRGYLYKYPIKLMYTSSISIILLSMVISHFYKISEVLYSRFSHITLVQLLGTWEHDQIVSGIVWYISPPQHFGQWKAYPLRGLIYIIFVCLTSSFFARLWIEIEKQTPRQIAKKLRDEELTLENYKQESVYNELNWMIPTATSLGAIIIGLLTVLGDVLNSTVSSTSLLLSVNTLYGYYSKIEGMLTDSVSAGYDYRGW